MPEVHDVVGTQEPSLVGARFYRARRTKHQPPPEQPSASESSFPLVSRGYAPQVVEEHVAGLNAGLERLRAELRTAQAERDEARWAAQRHHDEAAHLRARLAEYESGTEVDVLPQRRSLGGRADRLARQEALLLVATARKEAAEIVAAATSQAARDREEVARLLRARLEEL